jgi:hypothetical protein
MSFQRNTLLESRHIITQSVRSNGAADVHEEERIHVCFAEVIKLIRWSNNLKGAEISQAVAKSRLGTAAFLPAQLYIR